MAELGHFPLKQSPEWDKKIKPQKLKIISQT